MQDEFQQYTIAMNYTHETYHMIHEKIFHDATGTIALNELIDLTLDVLVERWLVCMEIYEPKKVSLKMAETKLARKIFQSKYGELQTKKYISYDTNNVGWSIQRDGNKQEREEAKKKADAEKEAYEIERKKRQEEKDAVREQRKLLYEEEKKIGILKLDETLYDELNAIYGAKHNVTKDNKLYASQKPLYYSKRTTMQYIDDYKYSHKNLIENLDRKYEDIFKKQSRWD